MAWTSAEITGVVVGSASVALTVYIEWRRRRRRDKGVSVELVSLPRVDENTLHFKARLRTTRQTHCHVVKVRAISPAEARFRSVPDGQVLDSLEPNWMVPPRRDDISQDLFVVVRVGESGSIKLEFSFEVASGETLRVSAAARIP